MSDPNTSEDQQPLQQPGGDAEQAGELVAQVRDGYNARLAAARTGGLDPQQVAAWRTARDQAVDDLDRLAMVDESERVEIALAYAARLKELKAT
ncbi:hypothetical protein [Streptomyces gardneri]|uniref:hypothetical protein n=1 Tax=Streptomyces gardneri TaxID=66892 RepID=UPI0037CEB4C5